MGLPSQNPQIWKIATSGVPSWRFSIIQICPFIMKKFSTPIEEMYSTFLEQQCSHVCRWQTGSALQQSYQLKHWMQDCRVQHQYSRPKYMQLKLHLRNSLQTTVNMATIQFSHSQSVLQAFKSSSHNCTMIAEIQLLYRHQSGINSNLCWVFGHSGVEGSKYADALVKNVSTNIDNVCKNSLTQICLEY